SQINTVPNAICHTTYYIIEDVGEDCTSDHVTEWFNFKFIYARNAQPHNKSQVEHPDKEHTQGIGSGNIFTWSDHIIKLYDKMSIMQNELRSHPEPMLEYVNNHQYTFAHSDSQSIFLSNMSCVNSTYLVGHQVDNVHSINWIQLTHRPHSGSIWVNTQGLLAVETFLYESCLKKATKLDRRIIHYMAIVPHLLTVTNSGNAICRLSVTSLTINHNSKR
ncbi:hypothetical protein L9F63_026342, partial [Diploptera punctata]